MDVQSTQFDSHRFVKRLTNAGLPEEVAEILADEHTRLIVPKDIATKGDVGKVEAGLEVVRGEMATKADVRKVEAGLELVRGEMATKADVGALETRVRALEAGLEVVRGEMATKADVGALQTRVRALEAGLEAVRAEMATKADLHRELAASEARMEQRLRAAILEAKVSLIKWMVATMMVFSGILVGAMTALQ